MFSAFAPAPVTYAPPPPVALPVSALLTSNPALQQTSQGIAQTVGNLEVRNPPPRAQKFYTPTQTADVTANESAISEEFTLPSSSLPNATNAFRSVLFFAQLLGQEQNPAALAQTIAQYEPQAGAPRINDKRKFSDPEPASADAQTLFAKFLQTQLQ